MLHKIEEISEVGDRIKYDWGIHEDGFRIPQIVYVPDRVSVWGDGSSSMKYFDISPDGSRLVFSTCAYTEIATHELNSLGWGRNRYNVVSTDGEQLPAEPREDGRTWVYNYEIVLSDIDGTGRRRLTKNIHFDNFPAWSPDGSEIAFISDAEPTYNINWARGEIITIHKVAAGKSDEIVLTPVVEVEPHPLSWSPDGERIAFVGVGKPLPTGYKGTGIYTVGVDGSGLTRISDAASGPAWSPDGQRIAVVVPSEENEAALYTFAADGSDPVIVTRFLPEPWVYPVKPWLGELSWSPDGTQILLKSYGYRVILDGTPIHADGVALPIHYLPAETYGMSDLSEVIFDMSWSPDGSQIALLFGWTDNNAIVSIADRDGKNIHDLVEEFQDSKRNYQIRLAQ